MYRDPWAKKSQRGLRTLSKIGTAIAKAHTQYQREQKRAAREAERRATAYNRMLIQNERERIRRIKQNEVAMRRAERERAKAERERERALRLQQKLQEQRLFEEEVKEIEDDNFLWTNVHSFIDDIITRRDIDDAFYPNVIMSVRTMWMMVSLTRKNHQCNRLSNKQKMRLLRNSI